MKYNNYLCMISGCQNDPKSKCNSRRHLTENKGHSGGRFGGGKGTAKNATEIIKDKVMGK